MAEQRSFDDFVINPVPRTEVPPESVVSVPSTGAIDLDDAVRGYVGTAVRKYRLGETYWYSVAPMIMMQGPAGPTPAYVVTMYARSPVVGAVLIEGAVQTGFPTLEEFDSIVLNVITALRKQVAEALRRP